MTWIDERWRTIATRVAIGAGVAVYLLLIAKAIGGASTPDGFNVPIQAFALSVLPVAFVLAFRAPIIFPFGLYVAMAPFDNILAVSSGGTVVRLIGLVSAGALLTRILLGRRFVWPQPAWFAWFAFVVWTGFTLIWTPDLPESQRVFGIIFQNFLMMTVLAVYPIAARELRWLMGIIITSGVLLSIYEFAELFTGRAKFGDRISITTGTGVMIDPNYFATSYLLPIAMLLGIALAARSVPLRLAAWTGTSMMMVGVLLTGSRGAFIAIAVLFCWFILRSRHRLQVIGVSFLCFALTVFYPTVWERFLKDPGAQGSDSGRTFIWKVGFRAIQDHLVFGTGIGSFPSTYDEYFLRVYQPIYQGWHRPSHDLVVGMWTELGLIGLFLILTAWYMSFRQLRIVPKDHAMYGVRIALEATVLGLFAQAMFIDTVWLKYIWLAHSIPLLFLNAYFPRVPGAIVAKMPRAQIRLVPRNTT